MFRTIFVIGMLAAQAVAWAQPNILATSVTSTGCAQPALPGKKFPATVSVQLNALTYSFYGTGLVFYFTNTSTGQVLALPAPGGNPANLVLPAGSYKFLIKTPPPTGGAQSASPEYLVTVPACEIEQPPIGTISFCATPPEGLRAWWPLDETGPSVYDITGNVATGVRYGMLAVQGMVNKAADFNGINDYIQGRRWRKGASSEPALPAGFAGTCSHSARVFGSPKKRRFCSP